MSGRIVAALVLGWTVMATASRAAEPIALPGLRAFPESIAATADGTLYVGSFAQGGVVRIKPGAAPEVWIKPGADGTRSTFGVLADEAAHRIWVCSNDVSKLGVPGPSDVPGSWLKAFDLGDGKAVASARLPGKATLCNDIAVGPDRRVYVTNSLAPEVLRLNAAGDGFEVFATDPRFAPPAKGAGLDGLAFDGNGDLVVDLFNKAELFRIDIRDGKAAGTTALTPSRALTLADAIRPDGRGGLLLIEGGGRLDRLALNGDRATIDVVRDGFKGPTGVTAVGGTAWVAEGRLSQLAAPDSALQGQPFRVYPVPLQRSAP